jgi:hypothetical protein
MLMFFRKKKEVVDEGVDDEVVDDRIVDGVV